MLPLATNHQGGGMPGWCTYTDGFDENPDIEVFCGGENEKTARAAACWRQGNLLHFGFEESPAQMSEAGQRLLLNAIAYISRFTEDRPIAVTPSVFSGPVCLPRPYLDRRIKNLDKENTRGDLAWVVSSELGATLSRLTAEEANKWLAEHRSYLHPSSGPEPKLTVDQDAKALAAPIDKLEFFEKTIAALRAGGENANRALDILHRYAPVQVKHSTPDQWEKWFKENRPYLFFSDQGDYRWYVDPLAKKRGIPSKELRGPLRASLP